MSRLARYPLSLTCLILSACISYEPAILVPALTLSPEDIVLSASGGDSGNRVDFGLDVSSNESDSLVAVEVLPGMRVRGVAENSAAAAAGIRVGDVILAIDSMATNSPDALIAIQQQAAKTEPYEFELRRGTAVLATSVTGRPVTTATPPRELYRIDPLASRAGYDTRLVSVRGQANVAAAVVVTILPDSPLPAANINEGDLILALDGNALSSAQDLVTRLNRDYALGDRVLLDVYDGGDVRREELRLWDPGRRISRIAMMPLLQYESSLSPPASSLSILDLWLFAVYRYTRNEGEQSHSLLGLINFTTDYGELTEETEQ